PPTDDEHQDQDRRHRMTGDQLPDAALLDDRLGCRGVQGRSVRPPGDLSIGSTRLPLGVSTTAARAAVLTGPRPVQGRQGEVAAPGPGEVQIATLFSGISAGTEMNVYRGVAPQWALHRDPQTRLFERTTSPDWTYPMIYGYANVGRVAAVANGVTSRSVGDV